MEKCLSCNDAGDHCLVLIRDNRSHVTRARRPTEKELAEMTPEKWVRVGRKRTRKAFRRRIRRS